MAAKCVIKFQMFNHSLHLFLLRFFFCSQIQTDLKSSHIFILYPRTFHPESCIPCSELSEPPSPCRHSAAAAVGKQPSTKPPDHTYKVTRNNTLNKYVTHSRKRSQVNQITKNNKILQKFKIVVETGVLCNILLNQK